MAIVVNQHLVSEMPNPIASALHEEAAKMTPSIAPVESSQFEPSIAPSPATLAQLSTAPASDETLYLIGRPTLKQFLRFVRGHAVDPPASGVLADEWRAANDVVRALEK